MILEKYELRREALQKELAGSADVKAAADCLGRALERLRIGCVTLDPALAPGEYRRLTADEVEGLKKLGGMA